MFRLDGKTALVTGASQGIGRACAALLARQGARVVVAARSLDKLESLAAEIAAAGGQALPLQLDLSQPAQVPERIATLPPSGPTSRSWSTTPASPTTASSPA